MDGAGAGTKLLYIHQKLHKIVNLAIDKTSP